MAFKFEDMGLKVFPLEAKGLGGWDLAPDDDVCTNQPPNSSGNPCNKCPPCPPDASKQQDDSCDESSTSSSGKKDKAQYRLADLSALKQSLRQISNPPPA